MAHRKKLAKYDKIEDSYSIYLYFFSINIIMKKLLTTVGEQNDTRAKSKY